MKLEKLNVRFDAKTWLDDITTETEKAAYRACIILGERDCIPMWHSVLIRMLREYGYSKSTAYRGVQFLADNGALHILRNHWGNAISCNMLPVHMREFWLSFVIPF